MAKLFLSTGSIFGFLGVALGAFGAHALKGLLESNGRTETFETAVKYQFYHAIALVLIGILLSINESKWLNYSGYSMIAGILVFSGSLYILSFTGITKWGAVTPIGGLFLLAGWIFLLLSVIKN
jgi:uncharacterized membrane protein YgdD (TMEM256/DUF423 family)